MRDSGNSTPTGILVIDKPAGRTSMQVVAEVRRRAGRVKTGHAGTLDPAATGVLVLALGPATRSIERLMATEKAYRTVIDLSAFTPTDDAESAPEPVAVTTPPARAAIEAALAAFRGEIRQRPPDYSAVKVGGTRAYAAARKGRPLALEPRPVVVHAIELLDYAWPRAVFDIRCGKGFYVRAFARALGTALGTGGHCVTIRRTAVGPFTLAEARRLDELPDAIGPDDVLPLDAALARVPDAS